MIINNYSLEKDCSCTDTNIKTICLWGLKLIQAIASLPQPKLTGNIQIDETFVRELQKRNRNLISYIKTSRYGHKLSKYGIMTREFATIITAVDSNGCSICFISCLGKLTSDLFDRYL